jgi:hypothetical protein
MRKRSRFDGHWARIAVRAVCNGRDLPGCGTGLADALSHPWQGAGMAEERKEESDGEK